MADSSSYMSVEPEYDTPYLQMGDGNSIYDDPSNEAGDSYMEMAPDVAETTRKPEFVNPPFELPKPEFVNPPVELPSPEFSDPTSIIGVDAADPPYVHSPMSRAVAEGHIKRLGGDGAFLCRRKDDVTLVLSMLAGNRFWHYMIGEGPVYTFDNSTTIFGRVESLDEMIQSMRETRTNWNHYLKYPITCRMVKRGVDHEFMKQWIADGHAFVDDTYMTVMTEQGHARREQKKAASRRSTRSQSMSANRRPPSRSASLSQSSNPQQHRNTNAMQHSPDPQVPKQVPHDQYHRSGTMSGVSRNRQNSFVHKDMMQARKQFEQNQTKRTSFSPRHGNNNSDNNSTTTSPQNIDHEPLYDQQRHPSVSPSPSHTHIPTYNPNAHQELVHEPLYDQQRHPSVSPSPSHRQQRSSQLEHEPLHDQQHNQQPRYPQHEALYDQQRSSMSEPQTQQPYVPPQWDDLRRKPKTQPQRQYPKERPASSYNHEALYDQQGSTSMGMEPAYNDAKSAAGRIIYQQDPPSNLDSMTISMPGENGYSISQKSPSASMSPPPVPMNSHPSTQPPLPNVADDSSAKSKKKRSKVGSIFSSMKRKPKSKTESGGISVKPGLSTRSFSQVIFLGSTPVQYASGGDVCTSAIHEITSQRKPPLSCEIAILPTHISISDATNNEFHYVALDDITFGYTDSNNESVFALIHSNQSQGYTCVLMQADGFSGAALQKKLEVALTAANLPIEYDGPDMIKLNTEASVH